MANACDEHSIRETKKGAGACEIRFEVRKRNGQPNHWCHTHGMGASAPDGAALPSCAGAWFDAVSPAMQEEFDLSDGEYSFWGALPPAIVIGTPDLEVGSIHVHHRARPGASKDVDDSFDIVRVQHDGRSLEIEGMAARAFSISTLAGKAMIPLPCPHCGEVHIDELKFATEGHRKHLCNSCGRNFWNAEDTISNPLAHAHEELGLEPPPPPVRADKPLDLHTTEYSAIALWPSNAAFITTMSRPEEVGIHIHAWKGGALVIDETHFPVTLNGEEIGEDALRMLAVQRILAHGAPIVAVACSTCGASLVSPSDGWIEPTTTHACSCGATTRTRLRSFANPLADK